MTKINCKHLTTLFLIISINILFSACANLQKNSEPSIKIIPAKTESTSETTNTKSSNSTKESTVSASASEPEIKTKDTVTTKEDIIPEPTEKKLTAKKPTNSSLTEDQLAMTAEELLNDTDLLLRPLGSPEKELSEADDDDEYSTPEEINFYDDFIIPDFAQKLLDKSHPDYFPPTGKLFGFMRQHLLKRGDSPKPWTIKDDFNGDKKPDWAALMVKKNQQLDVIVIYSEDDKYRLEVLFENAGIDNNSIKIALSQEKPGEKVGASYKDKPGKYRTATLEFPGINIMDYTKSSSLFYWHKYYFDELLTSN